MALGNGGDAYDWFFLALSYRRKGARDKAQSWFDKAVARTKGKEPKNGELRQFWRETAELLGKPEPDAAVPGSASTPAAAKPR